MPDETQFLWNPDPLDQIAVIAATREETTPPSEAAGIADRELVEAIRNAGLYLHRDRDPSDPDRHFIECPWSKYHGTTKGLDTYIRDGSGTRYPEMFHCSHQHSGHPAGQKKYSLADLRGWLIDRGHLKPPEDAETEFARALTDDGNAERLIHRHGENIRFCHGLGWGVWKGAHWQFGEDSESDVITLATETIRSIRDESKRCQDVELGEKLLKHAARSEGAERILATVRLGRHKPAVRAVADQFDTARHLVSFTNGTVNLRTGEMEPHRREDYLTRSLAYAYDPGATCPRFERFLMEVFCGDEELVAFMQRALGYSLTGEIRGQAFFFCHGEGSNGKSTLLGLYQRLLGAYATVAAPGLLLEARNDRHTTDIVDLRGRRFVVSSEVGEGKALAEEIVKRMTGETRMKGRLMHQNNVEFDVTFKTWLMANQKPLVRGTDYAIWRRILLIPFNAMFVDQEERSALNEDARKGGSADPTRLFLKDEQLGQTLLHEARGILAWTVRGATAWYQHGLRPPHAVRAASDAYRLESDAAQRFLDDCCTIEAGAEIAAADLWRAYSRWAYENGEPQYKQKRFGGQMTRFNFERRNSGHRSYAGLRLNPTGQEYLTRSSLGGFRIPESEE